MLWRCSMCYNDGSLQLDVCSHPSTSSTHQALCFVIFLVGFITVLCIGNYFRAKRAQERQRQRRLAKLAGNYHPNGNGDPGNYEAPAPIESGVQA